MNTYMMSLGQLVNSDINKSINAFGALLPKDSFYSYLGTWWIKLSLLIDKVWYKTIDNYKRGDVTITTEVFRKRICKQLGIKATDDQFDNAWNAMCAISDETAKEISDLIKIQQDHNFNISIISVTNELHINYVISTIDAILQRENLPPLHTNEGFKITPSCAQNTLSFSELANVAIQEHGFTNIISLHKSIANAGISQCIPSYSLKEITTNIKNLNQPTIIKQEEKVLEAKGTEISNPKLSKNSREKSSCVIL